MTEVVLLLMMMAGSWIQQEDRTPTIVEFSVEEKRTGNSNWKSVIGERAISLAATFRDPYEAKSRRDGVFKAVHPKGVEVKANQAGRFRMTVQPGEDFRLRSLNQWVARLCEKMKVVGFRIPRSSISTNGRGCLQFKGIDWRWERAMHEGMKKLTTIRSYYSPRGPGLEYTSTTLVPHVDIWKAAIAGLPEAQRKKVRIEDLFWRGPHKWRKQSGDKK